MADIRETRRVCVMAIRNQKDWKKDTELNIWYRYFFTGEAIPYCNDMMVSY